MTLDKIDLLDRKFSHSLLGYRRDAVDRLVAEAADSIGRLAEEKMALTRANDCLTREIAEYRSREATLRDTLLTTQQIVEDLKIKARQEAERILDEARDQAAAMLAEAKGQAAALARDIDVLAARKAALVARFRDMLLASLDILDAQAQSASGQDAEALDLDATTAGEEGGMFADAAASPPPPSVADGPDDPDVPEAFDPFALLKR
ncbi:DivIVA domain-containing protein [Desulfovibrio sp. TomC]|uniref:DivIVA domain-containing protein n=1 Tax=Desulfovibrio sp. TomC TaxID=1562888 RepID=UPI000575547B|nr:DivIVA domain-containing protein [Desulfovibrio sp. TomC]KHK04261.1 Cell division initiation protein DivIVA [Desulfovibrio sp. TomC]